MIALIAVIRELASLMFFCPPYSLLLNHYHNIHRKRRLNSRQLRLQLDHSLRFNKFCGTVEGPKRENQNTSDLSHMIPTLNRFYVPSLAMAINSDKQQFVLLSIGLHSRSLELHYLLLFILRPRCLTVINSTLTLSGR